MVKTTHACRDFVFTTTYRVEAPGYVVRFPDIPAIITSSDTLPRAFANACEALDLYLESVQRLNRPFPNPNTAWSWKRYEPSHRPAGGRYVPAPRARGEDTRRHSRACGSPPGGYNAP